MLYNILHPYIIIFLQLSNIMYSSVYHFYYKQFILKDKILHCEKFNISWTQILAA
jgi:hypothetical protein